MTRARNCLDHLLLGCSNLESGMDFVEQRTGVRPIFGGVHPGRGTCNALLSLGERCYLEVIAPDPQQPGVLPWLTSTLPDIATITTPMLAGWALRCDNIELAVTELRQDGVDVHAVHERSRTRADGSVLHWKMATLVDDRNGLLPFLIDWNRGSMHPADDAPRGCRLEHFSVIAPKVEEFAHIFRLLRADVDLRRGETAGLAATIAGPKGEIRIGPAAR